nr:MAG TPA: hypothetical protein [Caudoviricetes sp.]
MAETKTLETRIGEGFQAVAQDVGNLAALKTKEKGSLVKAINELQDASGSADAKNVTYGQYGYTSVKDALDAALYKAPAINSFTNSVGTVEKGQTVTAVKLTWATNKTPAGLKLNGEALDVNATSKDLADLSLTANTTYTLEMTDEKGAKTSKTTSITFLNGVYSGTGTADGDAINKEFVAGLTKVLSGSAKRDYQFNAAAGQFCYIAFPASYGNVTPNIGGFDGGMKIVKTFDYENPSGFTESYVVYRTTNAGLGSVTIKLK